MYSVFVTLVTLSVVGCGGLDLNDRVSRRPGPWDTATKGEPWPKPQQIVNYGGYVIIRPSLFAFQVTREDCDILQHALIRYYRIIKQTVTRQRTSVGSYIKTWKKDPQFKAYLDTLEIQLMAPCEELPYLHMDEHYELRVNSPDLPNAALLTSQSIWGILRGLETFSQLLTLDDGGVALKVNSSSIMDFPRYSHRGLLLDTSRHFFPLPAIFQTLDAMEANKLNVFHWHIVDDNSFPYQSEVFPQLSEKGAYNPRSQVYTREDIRQVIEHARIRGIRVIAEFDSPGHTESWGLGQPDLLTPCYSGSEPDGTYGPVDPINDNTYAFFKKFLAEAVELFPEKYIHLGGDEVEFSCWASNPDILRYMESHNLTDFAKLEEIYIQQIVNMVDNLNSSSLVWQEVFDNKVVLPKSTVVHIWTGDLPNELERVTAEGHPALVSTCWYLDHLATGGDWEIFYMCDPNDFNGTAEQKSLVMGGEACMWSEFVDPSNLSPRVWPRACAAAERLWSSIDSVDLPDARRRLEEHVCRLNRRGIPTQPANGPGTCPYIAYYH